MIQGAAKKVMHPKTHKGILEKGWLSRLNRKQHLKLNRHLKQKILLSIFLVDEEWKFGSLFRDGVDVRDKVLSEGIVPQLCHLKAF